MASNKLVELIHLAHARQLLLAKGEVDLGRTLKESREEKTPGGKWRSLYKSPSDGARPRSSSGILVRKLLQIKLVELSHLAHAARFLIANVDVDV
jgi:hypothetical protein